MHYKYYDPVFFSVTEAWSGCHYDHISENTRDISLVCQCCVTPDHLFSLDLLHSFIHIMEVGGAH